MIRGKHIQSRNYPHHPGCEYAMNAQKACILSEKAKIFHENLIARKTTHLYEGFFVVISCIMVYDNGTSENKKYDVIFEVLFHHRQIFENQP